MSKRATKQKPKRKKAPAKKVPVKKVPAKKVPVKKAPSRSKAIKKKRFRLFDSIGVPSPGPGDNNNRPFGASGIADNGAVSGTARLYGPAGLIASVNIVITGGTWTADMGTLAPFTPGAAMSLVVTTINGAGGETSTAIQFSQQLPTPPKIDFTATPAGHQNFTVNGQASFTDTLTVSVNGTSPQSLAPSGFMFTAAPVDDSSDDISLDFDASNNGGPDATFSFTLTVDSTDPSFNPDPPTTTPPPADPVVVTGTAIADSSFTDTSALVVSISGAATGPLDSSDYTVTKTLSEDDKTLTFTITIPVGGLSPDHYTVTLTATDVFGNAASPSTAPTFDIS